MKIKRKVKFTCIMLSFAIFFISCLASAKTKKTYKIPLSGKYQNYVIKMCERKHIDPKLVFAMMKVESDYNSKCLSDHGQSQGIMQVQPRCHKERIAKLHAYDMMNKYHNVRVAVDFLSYLYKKYGDTSTVLMAYNGGEGYMRRLHRKGIYYTNYVGDVQSVRSSMKKVRHKKRRKYGK